MVAVAQSKGAWEPEGCRIKSLHGPSMECVLVAREVPVHLKPLPLYLPFRAVHNPPGGHPGFTAETG